MEPKKHIETSRRRRRRRLVKTAVRGGVRDLVARVRSRRATPTRRKEIEDRVHLKNAEEVAATLGSMKGAVMKMGQMASFVAAVLPDEVRGQLSVLQQDAPPMTWELASAQLESEFGKPPTEVFAEIQTEPAAAASIGQVHKARLDDGTEVAVKIQYPGVDAAIEADLANADLLKMLMRRNAPDLDLDPYVEEFRKRVIEELDYGIEAEHQREFANAWSCFEDVVIPDVVTATKRVLVTEWYEGARFSDVTGLPQKDRNRIGELLFRYVQRCIAELGVFNGDPHPGNYIFLEDGRVVFLDFGCVKRLDPVALQGQKTIAQTIRAADPEALKSALIDAGYVKSDDNISAQCVYDFIAGLNEPIMEDRLFRFTKASRAKAMRLLMERSGPHADVRKSVQVPGDLLFLMRVNAGLGALLGELEAEANWYQIYDEYWGGSGRWTGRI